ncbi:MAG: hypothetical protein QNI99_19830 [Woeseiaceae bacterium]|nr:hypothetical protein [Woeseiaceae bacterium]
MLLLKLFALVVIALLPAVLLYYLFSDMNAANAAWMNNSIQLGGPVAAFFAFLYFLERKLRQLEALKHDRANPLLKELQKFEGNWKIKATSGSSGKTAESTTELSLDAGNLQLSGGRYVVVKDGSDPKGMGDWECELAVCDGDRLAYFYRLTDLSEDHSVWQGIVDARRVPGDALAFEGSWHVVGKDHHNGRIGLKKLPDA